MRNSQSPQFRRRGGCRPSSGPRSLARGESGQALVFGALTLFMLAAFVIFVADLGLVTSSRIELQNAADECAYSGALYEANVISGVAYLNEAMAFMYYDALRYAVDSTALGVLATMKQYGPPHPSDQLVYEDRDADPPVYTGDPQTHYDRAFGRARLQIPEVERTLNMFARWEWGMALACAELVEMEVNRVALKHGVDAIAMYPKVDFFPGNGVQFDLHILKLMQGSEHVGWRVWADDPPFFVEARKLGPFHWLITNTDRITYEIERIDDITYRIQTPTEDITVKRYSDEHVRLKMISHEDGGTEVTHVEAKYLEGLGWAVAMSDGDFSVSYRPFRDDGYFVEVTNHATGTTGSAGVRRGPDGHIEQYIDGEWREVPGQHDSVTVGGVEIPVQIDNTIRLGDNTSFTIPNELDLGSVTYLIPDVFRMPNIYVTMLEDSVRIDAMINIQTPAGSKRLTFRIEEDTREMLIRGLLGIHYRVPGNATCKWHANREGTERDRLCRNCQLHEGECHTPADDETEWTYQYRLGNPYFVKEDLRRFAHHAICDRDPYARDHDFQYPQWAEWYDTARGEPDGRAYFQQRPAWSQRLANYDSDGDGENDAIRIYASDTWGLNRDDSRDFDPHYRKIKPWDMREIAGATMRFAPPLRLSEDFFYYALTVGCWRRGRQSQTSLFRLFREPRWGVVATASARSGFLELHSDDPRDRVPHYRFTWPTAEEVESFVYTAYENLYEPVWTSRLWPMADAIRDDHIKAYVQNQTGLSYLFHGLLRARWVKPRPPEKIGEVAEEVDVPLGAMGLNADDPRMDDIVEH
ncbi:MAG: Tad domain-containing protein [Candidatus Brocadiia bacterium]